MKYPIGMQTFSEIIERGFVYVDKTDLVYSLANDGKVYFLSRPRRFGKSLLISTLKSYFLGERQYFKGLAIDQLEKDWFEYPVFHIDFNGGDFTTNGALEEHIEYYLSKWEKEYGLATDTEQSLGLRFREIIVAACKQTGRGAVVLVDEYDKPILDVLDQGLKIHHSGKEITLEDRNREILKGFYSTFKAADPYLRFVMLTGVTKFSQVSVFSGFNQPKDISMSPKYETICGISSDELYRYFDEPIREMAENYGCSVDEMKELLKKQYDGYHFSGSMTDIYNPFSVLNAMDSRMMQDYWFRTGTPTYLIRLLGHFKENLNELTGKYYPPEDFVDYKADVERPLPMIYQSGYLTIKAYNQRRNSFLLDFPNDEVKRGFLTLVANNYFKIRDSIDQSWTQDAVDALEEGDTEKFRALLTSFLASIPYSMRRKEDERERERYFHYTFYLLMRLVSVYTVYTEKQQSQGRVDCIVETDGYVYIFEFKLDGTAAEAISQIEERGYALPYATDSRKLYKIGASFSSETGTISDWKVADSSKQ